MQHQLQEGQWSLYPGGRWAAAWALYPWCHWCWTFETLLTFCHRNRSKLSLPWTDENDTRVKLLHTTPRTFMIVILNNSVNAHHCFCVLFCNVGVVSPWCQRAVVDYRDGLLIELCQESSRLVLHRWPNWNSTGHSQQRENNPRRHVGCFRLTVR